MGTRIEYQLEEPGQRRVARLRMADFASAGPLSPATLRSCVTCMHFGHSRVSRLASEGWWASAMSPARTR